MARIQVKPEAAPEAQPAPKPRPARATNGAPPFAPPPKRAPAAESGHGAASARPSSPRNPRQARATPQAGPGGRREGPLEWRPEPPGVAAEWSAPRALAGWDGGTPSGPFGERGTLDAMDAMGLADEGAAGGGRAAPNAARQAAAADAGLDCAELAQLLPAGGNDGIFDVVLPNGERMGVVVNGQATALSYLLSPASEQLAGRLRRQRMELEGRMERLTQRNVNITVL